MYGRRKIESHWFIAGLFFMHVLFSIYHSTYPEDPRVRTLGKPIVEYQYSALSTSSIDQIVDDGRNVYVLYGEHDGNVQVFTVDGEYCYSAYFYSHMNGAFKIATQDGKLYVKDERSNLYIMKDGVCEAFIPKTEANHLQVQIGFDESSDSFFVRMGSVWRDNGDKAVCVIKRPLYSALYQGNFLFFAAILICVVVGWIRFRRR